MIKSLVKARTLPVLFILGPTASGKTAVACELSKRIDCQLISVDSSQVYRRMDIGSAKPSACELQRYPHQLIDIREPWETYSAADFLDDVHLLISAAQKAGRLPVLVGGTMLYFKAFVDGLAQMPAADPQHRELCPDGRCGKRQTRRPALSQSIALLDRP